MIAKSPLKEYSKYQHTAVFQLVYSDFMTSCKRHIKAYSFFCTFAIFFWNCSGQKKEDNLEKKNERGSIIFSSTITILNSAPKDSILVLPKQATPKGMVAVPGGYTLIGSETGLPQERPTFWVSVKPFFIDKSPITVAEFRTFIKATHYKTEADSLGDAGFFDESTQVWSLKKGANWEYPHGKDQPPAPNNHPVTQVSWNDANAYARWAGKRLPYEIEWEHAARNGRNNRSIYPWGDQIADAQGKFKANLWQGNFPEKNYNIDGFRTTSPVGFFGETPLGLTDMTGNVWQWCLDWRTDYKDLAVGQEPIVKQERVHRGGSFLCEPGWCHGYRVSGRSATTPETALMHVGFRCVKEIE
jgi:formylglycine-generating enzyme